MCFSTTSMSREPAGGGGGPRLSRRNVLVAGAAAGIATALPTPASAFGRRGRRMADLTHVFRDDFPTFGPALPPPSRKTVLTVEANGFYVQEWTFFEHVGTHLDAPAHFVPGGRVAPELTPEELVLPAVVVDIARRVAGDPDTVVEPEDLHRFEHRHGRIPRHAAVFMYSGWERRVSDQDAFRNVGPDGKLHFPGFGPEAVRWLVEHRDVACIGVDTLSLDRGAAGAFESHRVILGADRYGMENVANLKTIPPTGATVFVGLVPWEEGSGGPCRLLAHW